MHKAWFPYDRNDRSRNDRGDHMETRLNRKRNLGTADNSGVRDEYNLTMTLIPTLLEQIEQVKKSATDSSYNSMYDEYG